MADPALTARVMLPPEGVLGLTGDATLRLTAEALEIAAADGTATLSTDAIDGITAIPGGIALHAHGRSWTFQSADPAQPFVRALDAHARSLGGLTRSLRSLGSARAAPGAEHDRFFQPLLNARRRAERAADDSVRLAAFDGDGLIRAYRTMLSELATARRPASASARRALEEELLEVTEALFLALESVRDAAADVRNASEANRLARWRTWGRVVRAAFAAADARWPEVRMALERPAPRRRSLLRRLLRMGRFG